MRGHWLARGTLALVLAAGCWVSAQGGDTDDAKPAKSSWVWPWSSKKVPEAQKGEQSDSVKSAKAAAAAARRLRAELDWKRRAEVCQKLRQIAYETNDDELDRLAERLDQRAWDAYVKQLGNGAGGSLSADERVLGERIGVDFNLLSAPPKTAPVSPGPVPALEER